MTVVQVTVHLPSMLGPIVDGQRSIPVEAETIGGALRAVIDRHPGLEVHLFDETRGLRAHVLCFRNETSTRWLESLEEPVAEGDRITILQAVSGG